jgi:hypothetical protein
MTEARADKLTAPWHESAARLAQFLERTSDAEVRLTTLKHLCHRFGDHGYPGFLKLLLIIAESERGEAQRRLADAIALGLRRGDAPSGVLTSWGATRFWSSQTPLRAGMLPGNTLGMAPRRRLDPLEYLTVWFSQPTHRRYLGERTYRECLISLIDLFNTSEVARHWYPLKIEADLAGTEGAFTRHTTQRLTALADAWKHGLPVPVIVAAADAGNP